MHLWAPIYSLFVFGLVSVLGLGLGWGGGGNVWVVLRVVMWLVVCDWGEDGVSLK